MGDTVVCEDAKLALWRRRKRIAVADGFRGEGMVAGCRVSLPLEWFSYCIRGNVDVATIRVRKVRSCSTEKGDRDDRIPCVESF